MTLTLTDLGIGTFSAFRNLTPGCRHEVHGRCGLLLKILPFGPRNSYAHVFFHESGERAAVDSAVLLPTTLEDLAAEAFPLSHLEPGSNWLAPSLRQGEAASDVRQVLRKEGEQDPQEADADEKDPEAIQSPAEAEVFNQLRSKELVEATLGKIFGDGGPKLKPGDLIDGTYLDDDRSRPVREVIYFVTNEGRPILHSYFNIFYNPKKEPTLIITRTLESIDSKSFRRVVVEETQKSSSFSAGLTLALGAQSNQVSSGPRPGDTVHSQGKEVIGPSGTGIGFNASIVKTYNRLRIEAELEVQDKLGAFRTTVTPVPPIGS